PVSGPPPDPVTGWIWARWAEVAMRVTAADPALEAWARRELTADPVGGDLERRLGWDPQLPLWGRLGYDEVRDPAARQALGQFFTPPDLATLVAEVAGVGREEQAWPSPMVLDPACGAGSLLLAVLEVRRKAGWPTGKALAAVEGWDRDPRAAWSCRAALVEWALGQGSGGGDLPPLRVFGGIDALSHTGPPGDLLARQGDTPRGVGAVVTNPPYLEAKRMGAAEPGLRERLRREFPQLSGAFDLYLAFCWRALEQIGEGGAVALVLPNKVLQGRYAARFRRVLVGGGSPVHLDHLVDLARLSPRPFPGTGVYPAILHLVRRPVREVGVHRVVKPSDLAVRPERWDRVPLEEYARVGGEDPLFVPFETWPDLAPLFALPRFGEVAEVVSTCSFHQRGLRERFVTPQRLEEPSHRYLGGPSRSRRTEVAPFRVRWAGWWIRYDQDELRHRWKNPLPDLHRTFLRPKAILCQHATRLRVVADLEGRFVTKDVYPVAWPTHVGWTLERLVAVLASTVFTALYNTVYQGILVGGETYHYLPAFLKVIPVPPADHPALSGIDPLIRELHQGEGVDLDLWERVDQAVAAAYGVEESARRRMVEVHLHRVGAEAPGAPPNSRQT
ncbi:MAG: N-6 DNA methylase, partial [Deltaproteobacteria bacterium]|nr:N-6 DNA methylase [Deltaproteobacteria bacterium]